MEARSCRAFPGLCPGLTHKLPLREGQKGGGRTGAVAGTPPVSFGYAGVVMPALTAAGCLPSLAMRVQQTQPYAARIGR
jgi:hypothetical protein